jgi:hypothetical protein
MPPITNHRRVADPLDMAIFENEDYKLLGWKEFEAQCQSIMDTKAVQETMESRIARLWYSDDTNSIRLWMVR